MSASSWPPKIERGVPLPVDSPRLRNGGRPPRSWGFMDQMKPGESFLVDTRSQQIKALNRGKRLKMKVTSIKEHGVGFRVWRL